MGRFDPARIRRSIEQRWNPIKGLVPEKLATILDAFKKGDLRPGAQLYDAVEDRDLLIRNVASKRKKAVARAQWEVLTVDDSPEAMAQKECLEVFYNNLVATSVLNGDERGGMGLMVRQMMDAIGKKFAVHEITWRPIEGRGVDRRLARKKASPEGGLSVQDSSPEGPQGPQNFLTAEFKFAPLWFFENRTGTLQFLKNDFDTYGEALKPGEWLVTVGDGIMEATVVGWLLKRSSLQDWAAFLEKFGTPGVLGRCHAGKDTPEAEEIENAVAQLMNDWAAVLFGEDEITLLETKGAGGDKAFAALVEYIDRMIAAIWRGADLSTISQGQAGVGASLQGDESDLLTEDDAGLITETLWDQVDKYVLQYCLGIAESPKAYIKILPPKRQNVDQDLKVDEFLLKYRFPRSVDDVAELYGRPIPDPSAELLQEPEPPEGAPGNGPKAMGNTRSARARMLTAKQQLLAPIFKRLRAIDAMEGEAQRGAILNLLAELPHLKTKLANEAGDGEVADTLREEMEKALLAGISKPRAGVATKKTQ
jgi:hypothetical protein